MGKFKVGDIVHRVYPVSTAVREKTGVVQYGLYKVGWVGPNGLIGLEGITKGGKGQIKGTDYFTFEGDRFALLTHLKDSVDSWDLEYAKQLRYEAEVAVCRYNQYLQQQPRMQPIVIQ